MIDIFLQPGEYRVADAGHRLRTLLGSCVSVTLWQSQRRIGAMSHFLLSKRGASEDTALDGRYAEEALQLMLRDLASKGVASQDLQAKIFGGGDMFPGQTRNSALHIGQTNGETARALMHQYGIPIVSESLFGIGHRHIIFDVATGHVWSRQIKPSDRSLASKRSKEPR